MSMFAERVRNAVRKIPRGETSTYGEIARMAGNPGAARAVGVIMKNNTDRSVPCHRVIKADGTLGEYNGLRGQKERLLKHEGYRAKNRKA